MRWLYKHLASLIPILLCMSFVLHAQDEIISISPQPLEVHSDSVRFTVDVNVAADKDDYPAGGILSVNPRLGDYKYDYFEVPEGNLVNIETEGVSTSVEVGIPFIEDMIGNELDVDLVYESMDGDRLSKQEIDDIAPCCITTAMLFIDNSQFQYATVDKTSDAGKEPKKMVAQFNFPLDIENLGEDAFEKRVTEIGEFLEKYPESNVTIKGFASPEGPYDRNVFLSEQRGKEATKWLRTKLREQGYGSYVESASFSVETTPEDWNGFLRKLRESNWSEYTDEVREVVSSGKTPAEIENEVLNLFGVTEEDGEQRVEELLAPLRRSIVVLETRQNVVAASTREEIDSIVTAYTEGNIPQWKLREILTQEEWLDAAQRTHAKDGKLSLLVAYYDTYPADYRVINDLAILDLVPAPIDIETNALAVIGGDDAIVGVIPGQYDAKWKRDVKKGSYKVQYNYKLEDGPETEIELKYKDKSADADLEGKFPIEMLELAYEIEQDDWAVLSNLGAAYLIAKDYPKAQHFLERSVSRKMTDEGNYNLALAYSRRGMYDKAVVHFDRVRTDIDGLYYNRGLAKMLKGDLSGAKRDLEMHLDMHPNHPIGHYILAIAGARSGDVEMMTTHLEKSIELKEVFGDIADEDLEFRAYWDTEAFEVATKD